jgi:hypothetical protein
VDSAHFPLLCALIFPVPLLVKQIRGIHSNARMAPVNRVRFSVALSNLALKVTLVVVMVLAWWIVPLRMSVFAKVPWSCVLTVCVLLQMLPVLTRNLGAQGTWRNAMMVFVQRLAVLFLSGTAVPVEQPAATMVPVWLLVPQHQNLAILLILLEHLVIYLLVVVSNVAMASVHLPSVMLTVKRLGTVLTRHHIEE